MLKLQDDSSINRLLVKNHDDSLYFKTLYKVRESIKKQLCHELGIEHRHVFLLNNTTNCLLTVMYGLASCQKSLLIGDGAYKPYTGFPTPIFQDSVELITHIEPNSGKVHSTLGGAITDAAQSIGTIHHHRAALHSDVVFFPLHKHLALAAGVALLCVRSSFEYANLIKTANIAEAGTSNLTFLNALKMKLNTEGTSINLGFFELSQETVGTLTQLGVECVTPFGARTPFLVFNTPRDLTELAKAIPAPLSLKQLSTNTYRITYSPTKPFNSINSFIIILNGICLCWLRILNCQTYNVFNKTFEPTEQLASKRILRDRLPRLSIRPARNEH